MTTEIRKYLAEIKTAVTAVAPDAEIILFGSQARGDAGPESDIDVLILIDREELSFEEKHNIHCAVSDIELKYLIDIQTIIRTRKRWFDRSFRTPFFVNVMNEGIRI